jgi:hypothetical protein
MKSAQSETSSNSTAAAPVAAPVPAAVSAPAPAAALPRRSETQADAPTTAAPAIAPKSIEQLQRELDAANAELSRIRSAKAAESAEEVLVRGKMEKGLTRLQAATVVRRQREFDESDHGKAVAARHAAKQGLQSAV